VLEIVNQFYLIPCLNWKLSHHLNAHRFWLNLELIHKLLLYYAMIILQKIVIKKLLLLSSLELEILLRFNKSRSPNISGAEIKCVYIIYCAILTIVKIYFTYMVLFYLINILKFQLFTFCHHTLS